MIWIRLKQLCQLQICVIVLIIHITTSQGLEDDKSVDKPWTIDQIAEETFRELSRIEEKQPKKEAESRADVISSPGQDRADFEIRPVKKSGKKIHIYLDGPKKSKKSRKPLSEATTPIYEPNDTTTDLPFKPERPEESSQAKKKKQKKQQEKNAEKDSDHQGSESIQHESVSTHGEIKEKVKVKHHHHHHHHNHIKTVVKKEPYPVEKVVHVRRRAFGPYPTLGEFLDKYPPFLAPSPPTTTSARPKTLEKVAPPRPETISYPPFLVPSTKTLEEFLQNYPFFLELTTTTAKPKTDHGAILLFIRRL